MINHHYCLQGVVLTLACTVLGCSGTPAKIAPVSAEPQESPYDLLDECYKNYLNDGEKEKFDEEVRKHGIQRAVASLDLPFVLRSARCGGGGIDTPAGFVRDDKSHAYLARGREIFGTIKSLAGVTWEPPGLRTSQSSSQPMRQK